MKKIKKGSLILDIIIAIMFISMILYTCYTLATSSVNKRVQIDKEKNALIVAENIMSRILAQGVYSIKNEPNIDAATQTKINEILNDNSLQTGQKNERLLELGGRLPVDTTIDAPFLSGVENHGYSYQVTVEDYVSNEKTSSGDTVPVKHLGLKKVTVTVFYPTKVAKYLNRNTDTITPSEGGKDKNTEHNRDKTSLEEEYRFVTLTTYKAARQFYRY